MEKYKVDVSSINEEARVLGQMIRLFLDTVHLLYHLPIHLIVMFDDVDYHEL